MLIPIAGWRPGAGRRLEEAVEALAAERRHVAALTSENAELRARLTGVDKAGPVIHVRSMGNLANRMLQYMAARALQARLPGARLANIHLPEWGIEERDCDVAEPALRVPDHCIDLARTARYVADGVFRDVVLLQYLQNVANFLPPDLYARSFGARAAPVLRAGADELLISLRMEEVMTGYYPFYTLLPVAFYREVIERSGLRPVFFGQLTPGPYLDALRAAFPHADFVPGKSVLEDFETLRSAPNLCLSVSTFAWAAAYLGRASRIILPSTGLLSPACCASLGEDIDLVPRLDDRYELWMFPVNYAVPGDEVLAAHAALDRRWRPIANDDAAAILAGHARAPRRRADYMRLFDATHYLETHPEIAQAVTEGRIGSAAEHFERHGFEENRICFPLDVRAYVAAYPDAADAVGFGRYRDVHHFHAARGVTLGYRTDARLDEHRAA